MPMKSIVVQMAQMQVSTACSERTAVNEKTLMAQTQIFVLARIVWKIVSVLLSESVRALMLLMMPPTERVVWPWVRTLLAIVPRILNWLRPCRCVPMPVRSTANPEIRLP
jgi:hypothetical protein